MSARKLSGGTYRIEHLRHQVFVAHEFSADMMDDLRDAIDVALQGSGLTCYYADHELLPSKQVFLDKILPAIDHSAFGIYDISNQAKANVFLELGAGIARRKICIITCKRGTPVPSDLLGLDRIQYDSFKDLSKQLRAKTKDFWPQ